MTRHHKLARLRQYKCADDEGIRDAQRIESALWHLNKDEENFEKAFPDSVDV